MPRLSPLLVIVALVCQIISAAPDDGSPRAHRLSISSSSSQQKSAEVRRAPQSPPPHVGFPSQHAVPMGLPQIFPHLMMPVAGVPSAAPETKKHSTRKTAPSSYVDDLTPKAKALKTEVRKAPQKQQLAPLPLSHLQQPMPIHQVPTLPTLPPPASVSFPTLATVTFPTISMPTFPTFTMPPPFSQLISTKKPKKSSKRRKSSRRRKNKKVKHVSEEYEPEDLNSVGSRMPKYVKREKSNVGGDDTPSWMVPYNKA
uniref:Extensin-like n=1 Tax=Steinernema glaseri TaxID=37863 RepID=A0A1I7Y576_9BILA